MAAHRAVLAIGVTLLLAVVCSLPGSWAAANDHPAADGAHAAHADADGDHADSDNATAQPQQHGRQLGGVAFVLSVALLNLGLGYAMRLAWPLAPGWLGE